MRRDARIGEAQAKMESGIKEAEATQEKEQARYFNEEKMAESKRTYEIEQAKYNEKIYIQQAQADLAYDLQVILQILKPAFHFELNSKFSVVKPRKIRGLEIILINKLCYKKMPATLRYFPEIMNFCSNV